MINIERLDPQPKSKPKSDSRPHLPERPQKRPRSHPQKRPQFCFFPESAGRTGSYFRVSGLCPFPRTAAQSRVQGLGFAISKPGFAVSKLGFAVSKPGSTGTRFLCRTKPRTLVPKPQVDSTRREASSALEDYKNVLEPTWLRMLCVTQNMAK